MCINGKYRLEDLGIGGLKIYQDSEEFCFGVDSVFLANYIAREVKGRGKYIDLCSGSGIIPILVFIKTKIEDIYGVEINENLANMSKESLALNDLSDKIKIINRDILDIDKEMYNKFDYLSVNPPYYKKGSGYVGKNERINYARSEILCTLDDIVKISSKLLKSKGTLFMVHRVFRLEEIILSLNKYGFSTKELMFIQPREEKDANLVLIKAVKNGGKFLDVKPPIVIYDEDNKYKKEYLDFYYKGEG